MLTAGEIAEAADDQGGFAIGVGDLGERGRFHVRAARLPYAEDPLAVLGVVQKDRGSDAVAADRNGDHAAGFFQHREFGQGPARGGEQVGVDGDEFEAFAFFLGAIGGARAGDVRARGENHAEVFSAGRQVIGAHVAALAVFVEIGRLAVIGPSFGDDHVADLQGRIRAARHASEEHVRNRKMIQRELQLVGGVDHAHAGAAQDDLFRADFAAPKLQAFHHRARPAFRWIDAKLPFQRRHLRRISTAKRIQRLGHFGGTRRTGQK